MPCRTYYAPSHAWYFVSLLTRLAFKTDGILTLASREKAITTTRVRLFNARRFVVESGRPEFNRYQQLSMYTRIKSDTAENRVSIHKLDGFDEMFDAHMRNPPMFDRICRDSLYFVSDGTKQVYQVTGLDLSEPQVIGLKSYFKLIPAVKQALVEQAFILLRK